MSCKSKSFCDLTIEDNERLSEILKQKEFILNEIKGLKDELLEIQIEMDDLEQQGVNLTESKNCDFRKLQNHFNACPKKGMREIINAGFVVNNPPALAKFLFQTHGLSKKAIGQYLGDVANLDTLREYAALHNFNNLDLLGSLRLFLSTFYLPGEAQVIERILMVFSDRYLQLQPPGTFKAPDVVYFLCMAVISLNVQVHNAAAKRSAGHITPEKWIEMARSGEDCSTLDETFLRKLYNSIKEQEFEIPTEDGYDPINSFTPSHKGWLYKQGVSVLSGRVRSWKKRYFVLVDESLLYFEHLTDKHPKGMIPLQNVAVREIHDRTKLHCFEICSTNSEHIKAWKQGNDKVTQMGNHMVYKLCASTKLEKDEWIGKVRDHITESAFDQMITAHRASKTSPR